ncbi:MAG: hypothetical protein V1929_12750 [bacterium]
MSDTTIERPPVGAISRLCIAFFVAVLLSLFFIPGLKLTDFGNRLDSYGQNFCHFPLFAAISAALLAWWPRKGNHVTKAGVVTAMAVGLAAAVEIIQPYVGRTAAWDDLMLGAAGCVSVVAVYVGVRSASSTLKRCLGVVATVLFLIALLPLVLIASDRYRATRAFPLVDSFERATELGRWVPEGCKVTQVREHATHGLYSLKMIAEAGAAYPSIFLSDGQMDWRGYRRLALDVYLKGENSRLLWIRADDRKYPPYEDRAQTTVELKPGENTIWIDLSVFSRKPSGEVLNLSNIVTVGLFLDNPSPGDTIFVDKMVLSAKPRS